MVAGFLPGAVSGAVARGAKRGLAAGFLAGLLGTVLWFEVVNTLFAHITLYQDIIFEYSVVFGSGTVLSAIGGATGGGVRPRPPVVGLEGEMQGKPIGKTRRRIGTLLGVGGLLSMLPLFLASIIYYEFLPIWYVQIVNESLVQWSYVTVAGLAVSITGFALLRRNKLSAVGLAMLVFIFAFGQVGVPTEVTYTSPYQSPAAFCSQANLPSFQPNICGDVEKSVSSVPQIFSVIHSLNATLTTMIGSVSTLDTMEGTGTSPTTTFFAF